MLGIKSRGKLNFLQGALCWTTVLSLDWNAQNAAYTSPRSWSWLMAETIRFDKHSSSEIASKFPLLQVLVMNRKGPW